MKYFYLTNSVSLSSPSIGIEDELNWHGKALGAKAEEALKAIGDRIVNKGPHGMTPESPVLDAPAVDITNIKLNEPPSYNLGDKVSFAAMHPCV